MTCFWFIEFWPNVLKINWLLTLTANLNVICEMNPEITVENVAVAPSESCQRNSYLNADFLSGVGLGLLTSLFSFYLLRFFKARKAKREGMLLGCLASFVLIIFLCTTFTFYTYYVQQTLKINRRLKQHNQRVLKIDNFGHFLAARVLKMTSDKVTLLGGLPEKRSQTICPKKTS